MMGMRIWIGVISLNLQPEHTKSSHSELLVGWQTKSVFGAGALGIVQLRSHGLAGGIKYGVVNAIFDSWEPKLAESVEEQIRP